MTYPHCNIPNETFMELIKEHRKWRGDIKYVIVADEHHKDGEQHKHMLVMTYSEKYYSRVEFESEFDLFTDWRIDGDGKLIEGSKRWCWLKDHFRVDYTDDYPKAGADIKDQQLEGVFYRRFHGHIKPSKGPKGIIEYCKKENNYIEYGDSPAKVLSKKDKNKLLLETPLEKLVEDGEISIYSICQLKKAKDLLEDERIQQTFTKKDVRWYCGPTGAGKTREAWSEAIKAAGGNLQEIWVSHATSQWYDGYHGQRFAILDDIRSAQWPFAELLRITDRYPIQVPVKGGFRKWVPTTIWITAPGRPEEVYCDHTTGRVFDGIEQLNRRISELREFDEPSIDPETEPIDSFIQKETKSPEGPH